MPFIFILSSGQKCTPETMVERPALRPSSRRHHRRSIGAMQKIELRRSENRKRNR
jgi:hypothetical protein